MAVIGIKLIDFIGPQPQVTIVLILLVLIFMINCV